MKKFGALIILVAIGFTAGLGDSEAAWKKRGWYLKTSGSNCVMRKVTSSNVYGKAVTQKIRVCR